MSTLRILTLIVLSLGAGLAQNENGTLLGKWRSVEISRGGIGAVVDFHADGTFDYSPGAVLGGRFTAEKGLLVIIFENGESDSQPIESMTRDGLRLGGIAFRRVGTPEDPSNLLIGVWVTVATMQGLPSHGYYYFRRDGRETFFIPFRTDRCTYSVSGGEIRLTNRQGSIEGPMRWDGNILTVPWGRGEAKFERF